MPSLKPPRHISTLQSADRPRPSLNGRHAQIIDGTLSDSVDLHAKAWQEALQHFGYDLPLEQVRHEIGEGADQLLPDLLQEERWKGHASRSCTHA
jgi:Haloacid dehalogenase-like hydrolase